MILKYPHMKLHYTKDGKISKIGRSSKPIYEVKCDNCNLIFTDKQDVFEKRLNLINKEYCGQCSKPLMTALAGLKATYDENGKLRENSGRFSRERVEVMTDDEYKIYCEQRKRAANIFHNKLKNSPDEYKKHYEKVFKNSKIGYISKAQRHIFEILKDYGFELEKNINGINCDIANDEEKIVFEYYGDLWHANPRFHKPDDYIDVIKMTASEKWLKDRKRNFMLINSGYKVIIIWENQWLNDRIKVFEKFKENIKNFNYNRSDIYNIDQSSRRLYNVLTTKSKIVKSNEMQNHLDNGWVLFKREIHSKHKGNNDEIIKN
jgi:G:T-mismatch repair DNA endonuclease (very short patch repair protein)